MKSKVHPKYKTTYRVGNWAEYDRALVRRGDVTLWLTPDAIATWAAAGVGRRSGQLQYSDLAIETALTLSLIFHLPLRQTEGVLTSIFGMLGVDLTAPDHTTLSRRGQHLALALRRARRCFRHQLLLPRPYLVLTKPLRLDIQCQRGASVKIGWKYLDD